MPNWTTNKITYEGDANEIKRLRETMTKAFDFNNIIPMPESLLSVSSPAQETAVLAHVTDGFTKPVTESIAQKVYAVCHGDNPFFTYDEEIRHRYTKLAETLDADEMVDITEAGAGDIVALFGIDCASGTTFTDGKNHYNMTSMHVPNPVIELVIEAKNRDDLDNMSKALNRFTKEDPTFQVEVNKESGETIIKGMGELHLDVYIERMRREYKVDVQTGAPQVAYRETITREAKFEYTHKKQTGGSGQFAKMSGVMRPMPVEGDQEKVYNFVNSVVGGRIPKEYIPSCDKGFQSCMQAGSLIGFPVVGIEMEVQDGAFHPVDSSDMAFQICARMAFREAFAKAGPQILEPIMKVEIATPTEFQGNVVGNVSQRRGTITGTSEELGTTTITAEVPLSEMFGYATDLRSMTQGKAEFTMEFAKYAPVPRNIQEELIKKYGDKVNQRG